MANSPAAVLLALTGAYAPPPTDRSTEGKEEEEEEAWSEEEQALSCGDFEALVGIWKRGERMDELLRSLVPGTQLPCFAGTKAQILTLTRTKVQTLTLRSLVPVYCHMLPASAAAMGTLVTGTKKMAKKQPVARPAAGRQAGGGGVGGGAGAAKGVGSSAEGLTRGQQVFRKLLASRRPGVMQILQAMGAMSPTCVPSPLKDASKKDAVGLPTTSYALANLDPLSICCLQLSFVEAVGVPGPGERYVAKNRMLKASLFDAYLMKFVGGTLSVELNVPKDTDSAQSVLSWTPAKSAPKIFVSADIKTHTQMYLYLELGQLSQRKSDTGMRYAAYASVVGFF